MKEVLFELAYRIFGHPQHVNLLISAVLGQVTQAAYFLTCVVFFALLANKSRTVLLEGIAKASALQRRDPRGLLYTFCCLSVFIALAILASQLNWSHLPLEYLIAMLIAGALSSLWLATRPETERTNALIPILMAPPLATLLICMPRPNGFWLCLFVAAFTCLNYVFWRVLSNDPRFELTKWRYSVALGFAVLTMALGYVLFCINVLNWSGQQDQLAIHWGVFVSGAQSLALHLRPFYDVPLQYGLGPSLAIYAFCNLDGNCWQGLYWLLVALYPVFSLLLYRVYLVAYPEAQRSLRIAIALLAFVAPICWNSSGAAHALIVPSTGPLRFLPIVALLLLQGRGRMGAAYVLAALNIWWSFDAAIMSAMCLFSHECARLGIRDAVIRVGGVVLAALGLGIAGAWAFWGYLPDPLVYLEYLFHMPGKLDPEFFGTVWIFFAVLGISIVTIVTPQSKEDLPLSAAIGATVLGSLLYFLSRSVSVNIDNLLPFIVLLTVRAAWLLRDRQSWRILCAGVFSIVLAGTVLSNWSDNLGGRWSHDLDTLFASERQTEAGLVAQVDVTRFGVVTILKDQAPPRIPRPRWGLINSWGAWFPIPENRQQTYTERVLEKMPDQRPGGCIIVYKDYSSLVNGYATAFSIVSRRVAGEYVMYGLIRKGAAPVPGQDPCSTIERAT